ncbi:MAG: YqhA family protein [Burkholderiales bacterium]|nr:YqhA family protein [Burkholderiales bacterium]
MLRRILASSRFITLIAVAGTFVASSALIVYEALVIGEMLVDVWRVGNVSSKDAKIFAVGLIEAVDVFLIAIALYIISLGLYALFVDDSLPLPAWLRIQSLDDLKGHLVSVVIAVLAVLFLREAVAWDGTRDILAFGGALALVIVALTLYLRGLGGRSDDERR